MNPLQTRPLLLLLALASCHGAEHDPAPPPAPVDAPASAAPLAVATATSAIAPSASTPTPSASPSAPPTLSDASRAAASTPSAAHRYVIAAIGDSLTDPRSHGGGYLTYLKTRCPALEVDNFAKGGTMVNQMRRKFEEQVGASPKHYTHLVIFGGVNDLYSDLTAFRTPAKIEADLGEMYAWGKAHGVKVVALTVAPWGGFTRFFNPSRAAATQEVNAWIRARTAQGQVDSVVDAYALLSCGDPDRLCDRFFSPFKDGIHFGPEGHQILGQALFQSAFSDCE